MQALVSSEHDARAALVTDAAATLHEALVGLHRDALTAVGTYLSRGQQETLESRNEIAELRSMMAQLRSAFDLEKTRAINTALVQMRGELKERDQDIAGLRTALTSKQETIKQLTETVEEWERTCEFKVREQKTESLARERELKTEVTRTLGAREHLRFEAELTKSKLSQLEQALRDAQSRERSLKEQLTGARMAALVAAETTCRSTLMEASDNAIDQLHRSAKHVRSVLDKSTTFRREFSDQVRRALANETLRDDTFDRAAPDAFGVALRDPEVFRMAESMWTAHREFRLRVVAARSQEAADMQACRDAVALLTTTVAKQHDAMAARDMSLLEHVESLRSRTSTVERQLEACREKVTSTAVARAAHRSVEAVFSDLLKDHAAVVDDLNRQLVKSEEEKRHIAATNKTTVYQQLSSKHELTTLQLERMTENYKAEAAKRAALETRLQVNEESMRRVLDESAALRSNYEALTAHHNAVMIKLDSVEAVSRRDIDALLEELDRVNALHRQDQVAAQDLRDQLHLMDLQHKQQHMLLQEAQGDAALAQRELHAVLADRIEEAREAPSGTGMEDSLFRSVRRGGQQQQHDTDDSQTSGFTKAARPPPPNKASTPNPHATPQQQQQPMRPRTASPDADSPNHEVGDAASDAAIRHLDNLLLVARRENAVLKRRLDDAVAQASESEFRRCAAVERNLAFQSRQDAAPRREANQLQKQGELQKLELQLSEREAALDKRQRELEVKEKTIAGKLSLVTHGKGGITLSSSEVGSPRGLQQRSSSLRDDSQSESNSVSTYTHKTASTAASPRPGSQVRLTPLALRMPPNVSSSTTQHPQKYQPTAGGGGQNVNSSAPRRPPLSGRSE